MSETTLEELEKYLVPKAWELRPQYSTMEGEIENGENVKHLSHYYVTIVDEELDPYEVTINHGYMEINTEDYTHISIGYNQLDRLMDIYNEAQDNLEKSHQNWSKRIDQEHNSNLNQ